MSNKVDKSELKTVVAQRVATVALSPHVNADPSAADPIAREVVDQLGPLLESLTSGVPWYKNLVMLGLLWTLLTRLLAHFGYVLPDEYKGEVERVVVAYGPYLGTVVSLVGVYYNRWRRKKAVEDPTKVTVTKS